jgi:hypothetical protein
MASFSEGIQGVLPGAHETAFPSLQILSTYLAVPDMNISTMGATKEEEEEDLQREAHKHQALDLPLVPELLGTRYSQSVT